MGLRDLQHLLDQNTKLMQPKNNIKKKKKRKESNGNLFQVIKLGSNNTSVLMGAKEIGYVMNYLFVISMCLDELIFFMLKVRP